MGAGGTVPIIYEASGSGLKFIGPKARGHWPVTICSTYDFNLTLDQYREMVKLCMTYASVDYGKKQILGVALVHIFGLKRNPFSDGLKSQVCSEIVGTFLQNIVGLKIEVDLDIAGPREIEQAILNSGVLGV